MSDVEKLYKFVQNKDAKWQGVGLTEEAIIVPLPNILVLESGVMAISYTG